MKNPKMFPWTESCPSKTLYTAVSAPGEGVHAAVYNSWFLLATYLATVLAEKRTL